MSNGTLPQPPAPTTWYQKLVLAKEFWHLRKLDRQSTLVQDGVRKAQNGTLGQPDPAGENDMPGDFSVGDTFNYSTPKQGVGTLGTVALTAAGVLGSLGLGAGAMYLMNKAANPPAVTPANPHFTDTSTDIGLVK